jgi:hypothetical protein
MLVSKEEMQTSPLCAKKLHGAMPLFAQTVLRDALYDRGLCIYLGRLPLLLLDLFSLRAGELGRLMLPAIIVIVAAVADIAIIAWAAIAVVSAF